MHNAIATRNTAVRIFLRGTRSKIMKLDGNYTDEIYIVSTTLLSFSSFFSLSPENDAFGNLNFKQFNLSVEHVACISASRGVN